MGKNANIKPGTWATEHINFQTASVCSQRPCGSKAQAQKEDALSVLGFGSLLWRRSQGHHPRPYPAQSPFGLVGGFWQRPPVFLPPPSHIPFPTGARKWGGPPGEPLLGHVSGTWIIWLMPFLFLCPGMAVPKSCQPHQHVPALQHISASGVLLDFIDGRAC